MADGNIERTLSIRGYVESYVHFMLISLASVMDITSDGCMDLSGMMQCTEFCGIWSYGYRLVRQFMFGFKGRLELGSIVEREASR